MFTVYIGDWFQLGILYIVKKKNFDVLTNITRRLNIRTKTSRQRIVQSES